MTYEQSIVTIDVDWAPDHAIDAVAQLLREAGVGATWFVTHQSPAIDRLRNDPLAELAVHPNFLPGSTHGVRSADVLRHVLSIVPGAVSIRSHSTYISGRLLELVMRETHLRIEANYFLPRMKGLYPVPFQYAGRELLRVPYFWADDYELAQAVPDWSPGACESIPGLRVYGFHPLSIVLNASSLGVFTELRSITDDWSLLEPAQLAPMVNRTRGVGDFFRDLLARLGRKPPALLRHLLDDGR